MLKKNYELLPPVYNCIEKDKINGIMGKGAIMTSLILYNVLYFGKKKN